MSENQADIRQQTLLDDYAPGATPGWTHTNDGHHMVVNSRFGMLEDGETHLAGGIRELLEETDQLAHPAPVPGRGYVGNRAFFALNGESEGTHVFAFELTPEQIEDISSSGKLLLTSWRQAITQTRDALSGMAIARLVAQLS